MTKPPTAPSKVKEDARGALAPSQADSKNDGALTISPDGDDDPRKKPDDHSSPTVPVTERNPNS